METPGQKEASTRATYEKMKRWYRTLPDKKRYLEFVTALLTIPVLLTVLLNNISTIQKKPAESVVITPTVSATPTPQQIRYSASPTPTPDHPPATGTPTPAPECKKEIGPIDILYPEQNDTITGNPVCLDIARSGSNYCSVVWSYRINGSAWSNYTDKTICMYGLDPGVKNLELRVKSIASGDENIIKRTFTVAGNPTPTTASSSAALP